MSSPQLGNRSINDDDGEEAAKPGVLYKGRKRRSQIRRSISVVCVHVEVAGFRSTRSYAMICGMGVLGPYINTIWTIILTVTGFTAAEAGRKENPPQKNPAPLETARRHALFYFMLVTHPTGQQISHQILLYHFGRLNCGSASGNYGQEKKKK